MSSEGDPGRDPSTTALSTVAVQAGDTQIIISVLKSGDLIQLQLTEAHPDLLEIGNNQEESRKLLQEHDQLMTGLKRNEGRVQELLKQADETMEEKQGDERVYEAMALSLSEAWTTLTNHLQKRRTLLLLTCQFYDHALEFAIKIDESEELQSSGQDLIRTEAELSAELMQKYSLLEKSMLVLNKSYELLDYLRGFQADSALKVDGLLELLQDRRRQVDQRMTRQIQDLELSRKICQWEKQEQEVSYFTCVLKVIQYLDQKLLGSSLSESEEILQEYKEFELKARVKDLLIYQDIYCISLLYFSAVFLCVSQAFEELAVVESGIKGLKTQTVNLPDLAKQHEELHRRIRDAAADPLLRAQIILQKLSTQSDGISARAGWFTKWVLKPDSCQAYRELAGKRQQLLASFDDLEDKVQNTITTPQIH
uniref:Coiled-coil domain containing 141 n=1 Tax=Astyanax mexicanus TaxID=7994 RepID=A0A3B1JY61_ASTMX